MNDDEYKKYEAEADAYFSALDYGYDCFKPLQIMLCQDCGYDLDRLPGGSYVHLKSRSTRCCNERVWHIDCTCHPSPQNPPEKIEQAPLPRAHVVTGSPFKRFWKWMKETNGH